MTREKLFMYDPFKDAFVPIYRKEIEKVFNSTPEQAAADLCDNYCKYPCIWDEEKDGPLEKSDICRDCPVNILVRMAHDAD